MPLAHYFGLVDEVAPRKMVDATAVVRRVREIKSEPEIDKIRTVCRIADAAFARIGEFARKGHSLDAVFRGFQVALLEEGADWVSYVAGGAGRGGYGDVISPANQQPLQAGDILMLDTGAVKDGYFCDFDRNFSMGRATDISRRAYAALYAATDAGLDALRPGMTASDLHRIMADCLRMNGERPTGGRFGHGLGLSLTELPSVMPGDETELRSGLVITLEPGVEMEPGKIMVHEENLVLRERRPELLGRRAPPDLPEIF
jgi:Xaa-Pro aminopeptidase